MTSTHLARAAIGASVALLVAACSTTNPLAPDAGGLPASAPTARYRVTFQATWSRSTLPDDFPPNAHFSRLVGGTHNGDARFWGDGAPASTGIKDMAERGRTTPLDQEVATAAAAGAAEHVLIGGDIASSPGSATLEFTISQRFPLVTLVSMIAPSPDWFVGVSAMPLFESGDWIVSRRVDLVPWDAGTDGGASFASPDVTTVPPQPIARIVTAPLSPDGRVTALGSFTFTRIP